MPQEETGAKKIETGNVNITTVTTGKDKIITLPNSGIVLDPVTQQEVALEKEIKQQLKQVSDEDIIKQRLADPEVRAQLLGTAKFLNEKFRGNWFDLAQMIKKTNWKTIQDALQILNILKMAGFLMAKMDKVEKYKIVLDNQAKREIIEAQIIIHETAINNLKEDLRRIAEEEILNSGDESTSDTESEAQKPDQTEGMGPGLAEGESDNKGAEGA